MAQYNKQCDCQACQTEWMNEQEHSVVTHLPWLAIWLGVVFWLCLIASCYNFKFGH